MSKTLLANVPASCQLYLLGTFRLLRDGTAVHLPRRKVESLLAYLVLHPQSHAREEVAALFWGDFSDVQARASLRNALTILRKTLGNDLLLTTRDTLQLNPAFPLSVDAIEFSQFVDRVAPDPNQVPIGDWHLMIRQYGGDLLSDFYDDWIVVDRERYRALYLQTLMRLIQSARVASEYELAMEFAERVLTIDPANESAHQHLMFCRIALGDCHAALLQYERCVQALRHELDVEPSAETVALYEWLKQKRRESGSLAARLTNLPIPLTSFVGREKQRREVKALLEQSRLATLTGTGGSGKTRLAIQVAMETLDAYPDGVWWVELAALQQGALVSHAVAKALGVREASQQSLEETLESLLREKALLLILDNCEHLIGACANLVHTLLSQCPHLKILTTSRESLRVTGEIVYLVPTLAVPEVRTVSLTELLMEYEAIRLFVERARAVHAQFALTEQNASAVAQICQHLDGIPLALELAAARVNVLSVAEIASRLDDRFRLLTDGNRTALPRQQTLRALLDWSYDLLMEEEQILFRRLSVFAGGFSLKEAEAVCADEWLPVLDILPVLARLIDKSLIQLTQVENESRYWMLETIREYGREKLDQHAEMQRIQDAHLGVYVRLAEEAEQFLMTAQQAEWLSRLELELDNIRAALVWSLAQREQTENGLRLAAALGRFWDGHGYFTEGRSWLSELLQRADGAAMHSRAMALVWLAALALYQTDIPDAVTSAQESIALFRQLGAEGRRGIGLALLTLGHAATSQNEFRQAVQYFTEALQIFREVDDPNGVARVLHWMGHRDRFVGDYARARELYEQAIELAQDPIQIARMMNDLGTVLSGQGFREDAKRVYAESLSAARKIGAKTVMAAVLNNQGELEYFEGNHEKAAGLYQEALHLCEELGNKRGCAIGMANLGYVACEQGHLMKADALFSQTVALFQREGDHYGIAVGLIGFAGAACARQDWRRATELLSAATAFLEAIGGTLESLERVNYDRFLAAARAALSEAAFEQAWAEGQPMTVEQAIAYALSNEAQ